MLHLQDDATAVTGLTLLNGDAGLMGPGLFAMHVGCTTPNWRESDNSRRGLFAPNPKRLIDNEDSRSTAAKASHVGISTRDNSNLTWDHP